MALLGALRRFTLSSLSVRGGAADVTVRFVVLLVVAHQVHHSEPVVCRHEVDRVERQPAALLSRKMPNLFRGSFAGHGHHRATQSPIACGCLLAGEGYSTS